jgi:hypothetical protein
VVNASLFAVEEEAVAVIEEEAVDKIAVIERLHRQHLETLQRKVAVIVVVVVAAAAVVVVVVVAAVAVVVAVVAAVVAAVVVVAVVVVVVVVAVVVAVVAVVDLGIHPLGQDRKLINDVLVLADSARWQPL